MDRFAALKPEKLFVRFLACWCIAGVLTICDFSVGFNSLDLVRKMNVLLYLMEMAVPFVLLCVLDWRFPQLNIDPIVLFVSVFGYAFLMLYRLDDFFFALGVLLVLVLVGYYLLRDDKLGLGSLTISSRTAKILIAVFALFYFLYVGVLTAMRYWNQYTSTFDLGIFSQMFYYMKETLLPMTTCERDGLLSHFAVHISPIYYLLLPGYYLFPDPAYLQFAQALVLASGVIPLYLLAKHFELSNKLTVAVCFAYCFFPSLIGGCFYDIHENCFLTPLILWLFYFYEKRRFPGMYIFAALTLLVKEDAAIFVACIALYMLVCRKEWKHGALLFAVSILWFGVTSFLLSRSGEGGFLAWRYGDYLIDGNGGIVDIVRNIFLNPAYMFSQIFKQDKIVFLLLMLLPVACLPLLNKKLSQLVLLIPLVLINVLPNYEYQYSIHFQYTFGAIALLFFLAVSNLAQLAPRFRRYLVPFMVTAALMLTTSTMAGKLGTMRHFFEHREENQKLEAVLETVPEEASVTASGFFVPALSQRRILYDMNTKHKTEYIVLDLRGTETSQETIERYEAEGYERTAFEPDLILVLRDPDFVQS